MAHHSIEEAFRAIRPRLHRGIPNAPTIGVGVNSGSGGISSSLSQAGQEIAQLQSVYQQQAALIAANTQAVQSNTSAHAGSSALNTAGTVASGVFGGALGILSPLFSGIAKLFGGQAAPQPIPYYVPPPPVSISAAVSSAPVASSSSSSPATSASPAPQITVNVNAMDSQSFMDRSGDIANAVREAMLNLHPINDVISSL